MESNKVAREKLFEIIDRFSKGEQVNDDFEQLIALIFYQTPYKNSIVFPSSKEELTLEIKDMGQSLAGTNTLREKIVIDIKNCGQLEDGRIDVLDLLNTLGHEYTHILQNQFSIAVAEGKIEASEKMKNVLESQESFLKTDNLMKAFVAKKPEIANDEDAKSILSYLFYSQLLYEENARDCGFQFAKEMFDALTSDELCGEEAKNYLTDCKSKLDYNWSFEMKSRNLESYQLARDFSEDLRQQLLNDSEHSSLKDSVVLADMRKHKIDKQTYFEYLMKSDVLPGEFDYAYLKDQDLAQLLLSGVMSYKFPISALWDENKFNIKITPEQVADACVQSVAENNSKWIYPLIMHEVNFQENSTYLDALEDRNFDQLVVEKLKAILENLKSNHATRKECSDFLCEEQILALISPEDYEKFKKSCKKRVYNKILTKSKEEEQE